MKEREIKLLVLDVDGTMTDAGVYYDINGNEIKKFCTRDAAGFFAAHQVGIKIMVLTGRESAATTRRMREMQVDFLCQNIKDKASYLKTFMEKNGFNKEEVVYVGDDLNDLQPMKLVRYVACPADSCQEIQKVANYVSPISGGHGVIRDVVERILRDSGEWENAIAGIYGIGL